MRRHWNGSLASRLLNKKTHTCMGRQPHPAWAKCRNLGTDVFSIEIDGILSFLMIYYTVAGKRPATDLPEERMFLQILK